MLRIFPHGFVTLTLARRGELSEAVSADGTNESLRGGKDIKDRDQREALVSLVQSSTRTDDRRRETDRVALDAPL